MAKKDLTWNPLKPEEAKPLIRQLLAGGVVTYSEPHAHIRMEKHDISKVDVANVLRAGVVDPPEWENGVWRYHVRSAVFEVVVEFLSADELFVVTAWRLKK